MKAVELAVESGIPKAVPTPVMLKADPVLTPATPVKISRIVIYIFFLFRDLYFFL